MVKLLNEARRRGVDVRVIGGMKGGRRRRRGAQAGMRLHVRAIVRDGTRAFVGSQSLRKEELSSRREVGPAGHQSDGGEEAAAGVRRRRRWRGLGEDVKGRGRTRAGQRKTRPVEKRRRQARTKKQDKNARASPTPDFAGASAQRAAGQREASGHEVRRMSGALLFEAAPEQQQAAFQVVLPLGQVERLVQPQLAIRELGPPFVPCAFSSFHRIRAGRLRIRYSPSTMTISSPA